ncbi:DUF188 domain-containing protein [Staphylococcus sp. 17KM0847]|uniref:DUF188 domain-containing protein n=1 Tax=Staphylococcus sp. 17KM0847 TaxID=2583989 RepID=UPI0015DCD4AD|nr:DUF188 domain-containing protein [Staphylococcus sp. 17KM0847]QLK85468.1 YaiI/YqxD family protein [Staphylococcus sp. 17KM0847]
MTIKRILIDGDACPVIDDIIRIAAGYDISVFIFRSYDHFSYQDYPSYVTLQYIDGGRDAVDFSLLQYATTTDLVVTQDYGLASLVLNQAHTVFHHNGFLYTHDNIDTLLLQRFYSQQTRRKTKRHLKGPKPFTDETRQRFCVKLIQILSHS